MTSPPPPKTTVSTYGLTVTSGKLQVTVSFNRPVTLANATHLADVMTRWCDHYSVGS
jgi:hypothetical protein